MTYVMSYLHGRYDLYKEMLERISFSEEDTLYILGDVCDRGSDAAELYLDVMARKNVFCIKGNHEKMLLEALPLHIEALLPIAVERVESDPLVCDKELWGFNGGEATVASFLRHTKEEIKAIYEFVKKMPYYREIEVNGKSYVLVHAGLEGFYKERPLSAYSPEELVWYSPRPGVELWPDEEKYLIVGHLPMVMGRDRPAEIYCEGDIIFIDCGAVFENAGGRLACLCLEKMSVSYIRHVKRDGDGE